MGTGGSIQELEKGFFRVWVSGGKDESGRRLRISERVYGKRRDAQKRLTQIKAKIDQGEYVRRSPETFESFIARWWPTKRANLGPITAFNYDDWLRRYILPAIGNRPVQKITPGEINAIINAAAKREKHSLADHLYRLLRMIFRRMVEMGEIVKSPMVGVERPRASTRELRVLSPDEWGRVRESLLESGEFWWLPCLHLAITTGMRRSEVAGLRWGDLDAERGILNVQRSVHYPKKNGGVPVVTEPKTRGSRRAVALDRGTVEVLLEYRSECERIAEMFGNHVGVDSYIFSQLDGRPRQPDSISKMWLKVARKVGVTGVRFHDLRHSAATLLLASGVSPHLVSRRLGHATVAFTLQTYAHVLPTEQEEAAERLARLLGGSSASASLPAAD